MKTSNFELKNGKLEYVSENKVSYKKPSSNKDTEWVVVKAQYQDGNFIVFDESEEINEAAIVRYVTKGPGGKEKVKKLLNAIDKIVKQLMRGALKLDDEKGEEKLEKILTLLNKEQMLDPFFEESIFDKDEKVRDEIKELINSCEKDDLNAIKNYLTSKRK